jgi:DMSO reductase family type II enzyme heme b subunit
MERPYFLMGSGTEPVYQWRWRSQPRGGEEGTARGLERYDAHAGAGQDVRTAAVFDKGEWRVVFTRALATADTANDLQFEAGRPIPIAFFAWDGSGGEHGSRLAVSSWYYLALAEPVPQTVFLAPIVAVVLTFGLGLWVVRRAKNVKRGA